jgi:hypothetical protein
MSPLFSEKLYEAARVEGDGSGGLEFKDAVLAISPLHTAAQAEFLEFVFRLLKLNGSYLASATVLDRFFRSVI